jgi:uncharacterized protein (DUF1684 family)
MLALLLGVGPAAASDLAGYRAAIDQWHAGRIERLRAADGWLSLIGLHAIPEGTSTVGSDADCDIRLDADIPAQVGVLHRDAGDLAFTPATGAEVSTDGQAIDGTLPIRTDLDGEPTIIAVGTVRFHVIVRGDRHFLRVKDAESPVRRSFAGIERYPVDPAWRVTARLITADQPASVPQLNVLGQEEQQPSPGVLEFELAGRTCRLRPVGTPGASLFLVFADLTSDHETYGGGRFLGTEPPDADGRVVIDFNKATNPPCAFTPFATCPMPSLENRLPIAVTAGEKRWGEAH